MTYMNREIVVKVGKVTGGQLPPYAGEYTAVSDVYDDKVLPTANRSMLHDLTILKIPQREVTNPLGGTTFIIGGND